jgi:eukaryotic-like serine/threonine-protein kinase
MGAPPRRSRMEDGMSDARWGFEEGDAIAGDLYVHQLLGGGLRYEAYLAWDEVRLAQVVVKVLRPDQVEDAAAVAGLAREARILERLQHPVIVRGFGSVLEGERPHLVLEFLEGPRLSTLLRKYGPLALEQAIPLATQLASALHYLEARGIAHLDVKPRNVIMGGPPRLIDLSVARTHQDASAGQHPIGTDAYMAPEQCEPGRRGSMGAPSDVWGLGITLYEGLTGRLPFGSPNGHRFPQLHRGPDPFPKDTIPPALEELILASLRPEPGDRPSAREIARMLDPLVDALPSRPVIGRLRPRLR